MFVDVCGKGDPTLIQPVLVFRPRCQSFEPFSCTIARKHRTASGIASVLRQQGVSVRCAPRSWEEHLNHFSSIIPILFPFASASFCQESAVSKAQRYLGQEAMFNR